MRLRTGVRALCALGGMAMLLPASVHGVSPVQQEFMDAARREANLARGAELFETCAACHGVDGGGTLDGQVPRIAGQHASVLLKQLVDFRHARRWDPRMEHFADRHHLADAQAIADVAAYVSRLDRERPRGEGNGELLGHGAATYGRLCMKCHGPAGEGEARSAVPRIAGQHFEYLRRQIYDAVDGRRPNFSAAHIRLLARLDHADIEAVADYLARLHADGRRVPGVQRK